MCSYYMNTHTYDQPPSNLKLNSIVNRLNPRTANLDGARLGFETGTP